jgi:hypothetical protein
VAAGPPGRAGHHIAVEEALMRYMLLIGSDKTAAPAAPAEMAAIVEGHGRLAAELRATGKMVHGERLRPEGEACRVRLKAGHRQVTDGPFAETKEAVGGFYLVECDSAEEAVGWAKKIPLSEGSFVEVRPIWPM